MTDDMLIKLKELWTNTEPHLKNITLLTENLSILEREGDEEKRKVANSFLELLKETLPKIKKEVVKTATGVGIFLNYSEVLKDKFEILFYKFENQNEDLGYWDNDEKRMYINILDYDSFKEVIKSNNFEKLFDDYQSTIFHELIHRFDHLRYSNSHRPADYDAYLNTYEEFNAFFQQYARSVDKIVNRMKSKEDFYNRFGRSAGGLINEFWNSMPNDMKKEITSSKKWTNKWNKRVYQLYYEKLEQLKGKTK